MTQLSLKSQNLFYCELCDYSTSNKKDYNKHLNTRKHIDNDKLITDDDGKILENPQHKCMCGKLYKYRQGLHVHKKKCDYKEPVVQTTDNTNITTQQFQILLELIKDNKEIKDFLIEQNKQLLKLSTTQIGNNNDINSHNKVSNKFNINMFLNEKCKDALNITDFVNQLDVGIKDLEETGRLGFADGISKIFINGLNQLDIHNKPIHCNDLKREVLYIKDSDKWIKEDDTKPILTKAIKDVAHKNMKQIYEWQKIHPEYNNSESKQNDKYLQIVLESMSGSSEQESEKNYNKIIRNLAKGTIIPKTEK
jgi:hypothetical protein